MKIFRPLNANFLQIPRVTSYTIGIIMDDKHAQLCQWGQIISPSTTLWRTSSIHVFSRHPSENKASLSVFHMDLVEHVFIFTVHHEGLGKTLACCFALGTNILLHPAPIKEHKKLLDSPYKNYSANECIVYCALLSWLCTAHCHPASNCSVLCLCGKRNDLYRPSLMKCELYNFCKAGAQPMWVGSGRSEIWKRVLGLYGPVGFWGRAFRLSCWTEIILDVLQHSGPGS